MLLITSRLFCMCSLYYVSPTYLPTYTLYVIRYKLPCICVFSSYLYLYLYLYSMVVTSIASTNINNQQHCVRRSSYTYESESGPYIAHKKSDAKRIAKTSDSITLLTSLSCVFIYLKIK